MDLTKEFLLKKLEEYKEAAEQHKRDAIANIGASQAIETLLKELEAKNDSV